MIPDRRADRDKIRPSGHDRRRIFGVIPPIATQGMGDTADHHFRISVSAICAVSFVRVWIKCAERDIVRPRLPGLHREMAAVVARDANLRVPAQNLPRLTWISVTLPKMDAIRAQPFGKAMLSLTMNANSCSAQIFCNGSANRAMACSSMPFNRS